MCLCFRPLCLDMFMFSDSLYFCVIIIFEGGLSPRPDRLVLLHPPRVWAARAALIVRRLHTHTHTLLEGIIINSIIIYYHYNYACMYVCVYIYIYIYTHILSTYTYVYIYVICIGVCMHPIRAAGLWKGGGPARADSDIYIYIYML